jgi:hypothetical protein
MDLVARLTARCTALEKDRQISADREVQLTQQLQSQASKHESLLREVENARDSALVHVNRLENEVFDSRERERELNVENSLIKAECEKLKQNCLNLEREFERSKVESVELASGCEKWKEKAFELEVENERFKRRIKDLESAKEQFPSLKRQDVWSKEHSPSPSMSVKKNLIEESPFLQSSPKRSAFPPAEITKCSSLKQNALLIEQIRSLESENSQLKQTISYLSLHEMPTQTNSKPEIQLESGTIAQLKQLRKLQETISTLRNELASSKNNIHVLRLFPEGEPVPRHITYTRTSNSSEEVAALEKRLERFKQVFKQKIKEFREVVLALLGWQIDLLPDGGCRMISLYAFRRDDFLTFRRDLHTGQMQLLEEVDDFVQRQFRNEREVYVKMGNSIPAFLAFVTNALWERSTVS